MATMINPLFPVCDTHTMISAHAELKSSMTKVLEEVMRSDFHEEHRAEDISGQDIIKTFVIQLLANAYIVDVARESRNFTTCEFRTLATKYFKSGNLCDALTYLAMGVHQTFADRQENTNA